MDQLVPVWVQDDLNKPLVLHCPSDTIQNGLVELFLYNLDDCLPADATDNQHYKTNLLQSANTKGSRFSLSVRYTCMGEIKDEELPPLSACMCNTYTSCVLYKQPLLVWNTLKVGQHVITSVAITGI